MPSPSPDDRIPAESARDAAANERAAVWRIPRFLELVATSLAEHPRPPADGLPHRALVLEPGRGSLARALADRLGPDDAVTAIVGTPLDAPAAPGGTLDEAFVERRAHAAALDVRAATRAGWPLESDEQGGFDTVVLAGGLAWIEDPGGWLDEARVALAADGRLLVAEEDPAALQLHPPVPLFEAAWRHRLTGRAMRGREHAMVRRMPELLDRHRLRAVAGGIASHGAITGEDDFPGVVGLLQDLVRGRTDPADDDRAAAASPRGRLSAGDDAAGPDADRAADALTRWSRRPGAAAWWPLPWVLAAHA